MRAERAAMTGPQGAAKLAIASDDSKTKSVIVADHVTKRFERTIIKDFSLRISAATASAWSAPTARARPRCSRS
jgi:hypothetical protein